jgi:hypothetical protein
MAKLREIADRMRAEIEAAPFGHTKQTLGGGLMLALFRNDVRWRLTLRRINVYPSDREVEICSCAFGAPLGTEPTRRLWPERVSASRSVTWYCVDLMWRED